MIGYSVIVAVLLIYLHSIDAQETYITEPGPINEELHKELHYISYRYNNFGEATSYHTDYVCLLFGDGKRAVCDHMMVHMINRKNDGAFVSFVGKDSSLAIPSLVNSIPHISFICKSVYVGTYNFEKYMYYCHPRRYKTDSGKIDQIEGFFCAGVLENEKRVYAFRTPQLDSDHVEPVGELIDVDIHSLREYPS